jgi:peptidyl-tRNA hydrolase, PTH1 family
MYLIVGLGNPGVEYKSTRHNIGFLVVDLLAASCNCEFRPGQGEYWFANCSLKNTEVTLLKPVTSMNNSGFAVKEFVGTYNVPLTNILVVSDDFQLPLGSIRLRPQGSDGGHNGLASIIYHLQSDVFARLRCGIGSANMLQEESTQKDFVLDQFHESELLTVQQMIERAKNACESYIIDGLEQTMNLFNAKPIEEVS